jgi:hypothetical protein
MEQNNQPTLIEMWKSRKLRQKQQEIEELKLEIIKAKLEKDLREINSGEVKHEK